ncbi:cytochrome ubiquinol oxidase subunit I [Mucilaginibacter celer]|uniref:Cytochrome ubiquinol oxidase subunit I n=1 Tax=Mucilaginibacter celer TaxID=2305508 RepID=A0A494VWN3_9SPHI|nr:cytochrome ubiquinol oxidase subunit I [Mucilaginibacter celer]AYL95392.1 cytochrome ubiquinol oxidase subunit I [Mucilaginibacter celer]
MKDLAESLSRFQFGFTASFHIIFPSLSIGLAWFLVLIHALYLKTGKAVYFSIYKFWSSIFALNFAIGVVTGIFMSFQFGLNWSRFSYAAGPVLGSIIGMEVMTAFFLEAGFLGIMLLGWNRVKPGIHFFATFMVALGTLISATWIVGANSWLQTPAGYTVRNGQFFISEWWHAVFNPAFVIRYPHMLLASIFSSAFLIAGISSWYLIKRRHLEFGRVSFSIAMAVITVMIPLQLWVGDTLYMKMSEFQPAKTQALEGFWTDTPNAPYLIYINPDSKNQYNKTQIGIPYLGSILVTHTLHGAVPGLRRTSPELQPSMGMTFYFFRVMFFIAVLIFFVALTSVALRFTGRLYDKRWFLKLCLWMTPAGVIATVAGWITSETGRQPYIIYGKLKTVEGSSLLNSNAVVFSFTLFVVVYLILLFAYISHIARMTRKGPGELHRTLRSDKDNHPDSVAGFPGPLKIK